MGIIDYYAAIDHFSDVKMPPTLRAPEVADEEHVPLLPDARVVTLAQFDSNTKNAITAHRLKDYRRKTFKLTMLPDIHLWLDDIMEGSTYWYEKLHNESPYS